MGSVNYQKSYRITIGVPEFKKESYIIEVPLAIPPFKQEEDKVIPATSIPAGDIIKLSNLVVDDNPKRGFYFTFNSVRTVSTAATKGEKTLLKLYNINDETLNVINQENCRILIEAGYDEKVSLVYSGDVVSADTRRQGTDVITNVRLKELGIDVKNTRISITFDESASLVDVIGKLTASFPAAATGVLALEKFKHTFITGGYTFQGSLIRILEKLCEQHDLMYSIFNGVITVQEAQLVQGTPSYLLVAQNIWKLDDDIIKALDGNLANKDKKSAQKNVKRGITLSTFLIPIEISQFFEVSSEVSKDLAGTYKITSLGVNLDSRLGAWDVQLKGEPL